MHSAQGTYISYSVHEKDITKLVRLVNFNAGDRMNSFLLTCVGIGQVSC